MIALNEILDICFEFYEIWDETIESMAENKFDGLVKKNYSQLIDFK